MHSTGNQAIEESRRLARVELGLQTFGIVITRYGLAVVLLLIGILKFTPGEAAGIRPLVEHSPLMSWMYSVMSVQGVSNLIGIIEIIIAVLISLRPISAKLSLAGSLGSIVTFLITTSFLVSTPGAIALVQGWPELGDAGQFLIKDIVLLGASVWTAGDALSAV